MSASRLPPGLYREYQKACWRTTVDPAEWQGCKRNAAVYYLDYGADVGPPLFLLVRGALEQIINL